MSKQTRKFKRPVIWIGLALLYAFPLFSLMGAVDMFLKLDGIDGESKDKVHPNEIDVLSWSWGMTQSGSFHAGGGGGAGKVNVNDLSVTKWIDKSTPDLMLHVLTGKHIPTATLTITRDYAAGKYDYVVLKLQDVIVTSVETGGEDTENQFMENVTFNFGKFTFEYRPLDPTTGNPGSRVSIGWDIVENKPL